MTILVPILIITLLTKNQNLKILNMLVRFQPNFGPNWLLTIILQVLNFSGKSHQTSLLQSRKNGKPIISVSCNTFYKLSNALTACCSPFQSSYLKLMKDRFLPPPLPVVFSSTVIEWTKDDKEATHFSLLENVALKDYLLPKHVITKFSRGIPYDYSCLSTKDALKERVWKHYGLYFGSIKSKQNHSPNCTLKKSHKSSDKQSTQPMRKVQPKIEASAKQSCYALWHSKNSNGWWGAGVGGGCK